MPIFDYYCADCGHSWESIEAWPSHAPTKCPKCRSQQFHKVFTVTKQQIRMDAEAVLKSVPDPTPPLEELRGKTKRGCVGGFEDKPEASRNLKDYTRRKDKYGNSIWEEKKRSYFNAGGSKKSSAEKD